MFEFRAICKGRITARNIFYLKDLMKTILAISGSLRAYSTNLRIIENITEMFADKIKIIVYNGLANLPQFNPDLDNDDPPTKVRGFRQQINAADGVLICTPEYVFGVPGALKNAIDWTVSSGEFMNKPAALITASSLGEKAHESLLLTLKTIEARVGENQSLLISGARTKLNSENKISDEETIKSIRLLMLSLIESIEI